MCRSMVEIQSVAAEIRRGKKRKKKDRNHRMKIYMVSLLHRATINKCTCQQWKQTSVSLCTYNDKNECKRIKHYMYLKRQRGTNEFLCISLSHLGCVYMSFGSEVMVTRFNGRKERMNTMTGISHFTK